MSVAIVTGSSGLIGSETVKFLHEKGMQVVGIDNDMRRYFFGEDASTAWNTRQLQQSLKNFQHFSVDVRDDKGIEGIFKEFGERILLVVHTAAQPSHDWAAREPWTDFTINANSTLILLEATRRYCPDATFIFTSTNKVYGDTPNTLPLVEHETRWEIAKDHPFHSYGIDEGMNIDQSMHSLFGVSKLAGDVAAQEYGRYFGLKTGIFRGGCLTGPAHSSVELHGFLAYLAKCAVTGKAYTIHGYKGKQVRDHIHSNDLVNAFWHFFRNPRPGEVYNIGGSRHSNCSILEAITLMQELTGNEMNCEVSEQARSGDHIWWISDVRKFQQQYPSWKCCHSLKTIIQELVETARERTRGPSESSTPKER